MIFDPFLQEYNPSIQNASGYTGGNNMHSRHPMFRMPEWMSEDDDVSNLASRMSQGPNWAFGNRGPWRERQNPGDNEGLDRGETVAHNIPIRIEAEAPPGCMPQQTDVQESKITSVADAKPSPTQDSINPDMRIGKQPAYASKTTPAVDSCVQQDIPRDARSSSAPPEMKDKETEGPRFISKINITPQQPQTNATHTFNNIAKPFPSGPGNQSGNVPMESDPMDVVDSRKPIPLPHNSSNVGDDNMAQHQQNVHQDQQRPQPNPASQKGSVVRNIPILFEAPEEIISNDNSKPAPPPPTRQPNQPRGPNWNQQFGNIPDRFHDEMFQDPFFGFSRFGSPSSQRRGQPMPNEFSENNYNNPEHPQNIQSHNFQQPNFTQIPTHMPYQEEFKQQKQPPHEKLSDQGVEVKVTKESPPQPQQPRDIEMEKMNKVRQSLTEYQKKVDSFNATQKTKEYRYLDEMLTRSLLELDNIEVNGKDDIRQVRRTLIKDINATITALEQRISIPADAKEAMVIHEKKESSPDPSECRPDSKKTKIEVEGKQLAENLNNKGDIKANGIPANEIKEGSETKVNT